MASEIESTIKALSDNREGIRRFAIRRLSEIGPSAAPALIEALKTCGQEISRKLGHGRGMPITTQETRMTPRKAS